MPRIEPNATAVRQRSELEVRWRQTRNAPPPVVRAVVANVSVAAGRRHRPAVDRLARELATTCGEARSRPSSTSSWSSSSGSLLTYLWVELPTGASGERRRSAWAGVLGLFASIPIVYLSLVVIFQVLRPLLP